MATHEIVPTSAFTKGTAERKKSATSFSLPGFASSGTYSANFVITLSCLDRGHQVRRPAPHISHPRHCPLSPASLSLTNLVKAHERECFGNIASLGAVLRLSPKTAFVLLLFLWSSNTAASVGDRHRLWRHNDIFRHSSAH